MRLILCTMTCAECRSRSWVVLYVRGVCAQHRAHASICAEVIDCNMRYVIAFASRTIDSTSSSNCFLLYFNTFYQHEHVLLSTIYIRAFGRYIMAIWAVAFIEICSSDPTFFMFLIYSDGYYGAAAAIVGSPHTIRVSYQQHQHNLSYSW